MCFIAALLIVCSVFETGANALVSWLLGVALIGFRIGCRSHKRENERRINGRR